MKRLLPALVGALASVTLLPAVSVARTVELGQTATPVQAPVCPPGVPKANCTIILTEVTALESSSDSVLYPTTVRSAGRIVAYTLGLAKLSKGDIAALNAAYGGVSYVQLSVLRPGKQRFYTVTAQSKPNFIQPWFGHVTQWPLTQSLPVQKGDVVALTVPTWAPVLSINLPSDPFQYRASRTGGCALASTFSTQNAQLTIGDKRQYLCFYKATRVEYTATEIVSPPIPKDAVK